MQVKNISYERGQGQVTITRFTGNERALVIPSVFDDMPVTAIGDWAFNGCSGLAALNLPTGLTAIGYAAFEGCSGLTALTLPASLTAIGDAAFRGCSGLASGPKRSI